MSYYSIIKRNNLNLFSDNLFDWFLGSPRTPLSENIYPSTRIKEKDKHYEIKITAPGIKNKGENIKITLKDDILNVSINQKSDGGSDFFSYNFERSWTVSRGISEEDVSALYEDGILTLKINKKEEQNGTYNTLGFRI
jgi:HSP20 family protein